VSGPGPQDASGPDDALAANYARGGFGQSLAWGSRPALVMVDLIRAYFEPGAAFYTGSDACLSSAARVLAAARAATVPVLYTRVEYDQDGINGGLFVRKIPALRQLVRPGGEVRRGGGRGQRGALAGHGRREGQLTLLIFQTPIAAATATTAVAANRAG
jgi:hypothetical protein